MLQKSHFFIFIIVAPMIVVIGTLFVIEKRPPTLEKALNEYVAEGYLDDTNNQLIWNVTKPFVQNTQFQDKVVINAPASSNSINIYILKQDPKQYFTNLQCNCAYLGQENTIVCDSKLLQYFRDLIEIPAGGFSGFIGEAEDSTITAQINSRFNYFLLQWILGHEIGHLMLNHGTGQYHFRPQTPNDYSYSSEKSEPSAVYQYEQEADLFAIEHLDPNNADDHFWVWLGLSNVVGAMYSQEIDQQGVSVDGSLFPSIELTSNPDMHPPWLIRVLDMATVLVDTYPTVVDESGYFDQIRESISLVPTGSPPPLLCEETMPPIEESNISLGSDLFNGDYRQHIQQGFEYWQLTEYKRAIAEFTMGIDIITTLTKQGYPVPPQLLEAYLQRGVIYFIQGEYEQATLDWEASLEIAPNDARASNNLGFVYYELDRLDEAITQWESTVALDEFLDDAWAGMGIALYAEGRTEEAIAMYQKAIEIEPQYTSLNWLRYERSWTEKSLQDASEILKEIQP